MQRDSPPHPGSTIAALSSGSLPAGVAVVRVSGPATQQVLHRLTGNIPRPRVATYRALRLTDGSLLDRGLVLFFPGPASFTGEDCGEFHVHGGRAVVAALLNEVCSMAGCRLAEPGEFMQRAFLNGKVGLLEAEATADMISAETEGQRRFAASNGEGRHRDLYAAWRAQIVSAMAMIEAELDFADEDDVPGSVSDRAWAGISRLSDEIARHTEGYSRAEIVRDGFLVVLLGAPNAGKSSLLNALAGREAAIVTDEAGTTRDMVEVVLDLAGCKVRITDTAGIREPAGRVEQIGIERSLARARQADLILEVSDITLPYQSMASSMPGVQRLTVATKADLSGQVRTWARFHVSSLTGAGLDALTDELSRLVAEAAPAPGEIVPWKARHVELLRSCSSALRRSVDNSTRLEVRAEELRSAAESLGKIAGAVGVEDVLDAVFSHFCIGK